VKKFIKKIIIFSIIIFSLGSVISLFVNHFFKKSQFYKPSFLVNNFKKDNKFDFFIAGSSRGLTSINSTLIDKKLGTNGVNLSMDDTGLNTQFLMIRHFFLSGFTSNYCILVLDESHFFNTPKKIGNNDYRFVTFSNEEYVKKYYDEFDKSSLGLLKHSNINPFFTYSYYNLELFYPGMLSAFKPNFRNKFDQKGNYSYPNSGKEFGSKNRKEIAYIISNPLIKEIETFLIENNSKLIIYIAPYADKNLTINTSYNLINHSYVVNNDTLFYDNIHVNNKGREKATSLFIDSFKNYLEDDKK
jgi:hypothetical protein